MIAAPAGALSAGVQGEVTPLAFHAVRHDTASAGTEALVAQLVQDGLMGAWPVLRGEGLPKRGQRPTRGAQRMGERQGVRIAGWRLGAQRGLVHQRPQREVCQEKTLRFLRYSKDFNSGGA